MNCVKSLEKVNSGKRNAQNQMKQAVNLHISLIFSSSDTDSVNIVKVSSNPEPRPRWRDYGSHLAWKHLSLTGGAGGRRESATVLMLSPELNPITTTSILNINIKSNCPDSLRAADAPHLFSLSESGPLSHLTIKCVY